MNSFKVIKESQNLILAFQKLRKIIFDNCSENDKTIWQKRLTKKLYLCNRIIRNAKLSIGVQRKLQTVIEQLKTARKLILKQQ